ncbi:MAG: cell division topological specificity factor MinE [Chloroflexi bacterium]|nr:cell division topological specificity factor MinE [Chloroflexota bacterium]
MDFLARVFGRSPRSANVAKERLQLVLAHDRTNISPETLGVLKDEIINVISRHVEIDRENVEVSFSRTERSQRLVANIPLIGARKARK